MTPDEAREVDAMLRSFGIAGVVAPVDPEHSAGAWAVYDVADPATRRDITSSVLASVARVTAPATRPRPAKGGATRGFVIPPKGPDAA